MSLPYSRSIELYQQYAVEIVEKYAFCPWAESARKRGKVDVLCMESEDRDAIAKALSNDNMDIVQLIFPNWTGDLASFEKWVKELDEHPRFFFAVFGPMPRERLEKEKDFTSLLRCSPDFMIQAVRRCAVPADSLGSGYGGQRAIDLIRWPQETAAVSEKIAMENRETVKRVGREVILEKVMELRRQRLAWGKAV